ncbi:uncharacterized protein LOC141900693 [Tubulanus polymorphus]|uniref:uncharacterized protein LOC141900693 n=1 Tax=Tubulanus polymorphus TaxID=672921 RepID=UPI003DA6A804
MAHASESLSYPGPVAQTNESAPSGDQSTKQLDFYQAMSDFKLMFPNMDEEIIEAVLRANNGAVDGTIDQLLTMNIDTDTNEFPPDIISERPLPLPADSSLPPSYDEAVSNLLLSEETDEKRRGLPPDLIAATNQAALGYAAVAAAPASKRSDVDLLSSDLDMFQTSLSAQPLSSDVKSKSLPPYQNHHHAFSGGTSFDLPAKPASIERRHTTSSSSSKHHHHQTHPFEKPTSQAQTTRLKKPFKRWNPPLLGALPDDFLRLSPTAATMKAASMKRHSGYGRQGLHLAGGAHSSVHRDNEIHSTVFIQGRSPSPNAATSLGSPPKLPPRSHHATNSTSEKKKNSTLLRRTQSELNSEIIKQKMADNIQRRTSMSGAEVDPIVIQQLEDEHLALMLQNKEFLETLRQDKDFMKTLERDRMNATAFDFGPELAEPVTTAAPVLPLTVDEPLKLDPILPDESALAQGYGDDNSKEIGAFPFTKELPPGAEGGDANAEFKRQLKNMGQSSKNKFQALAKKFFSRRRKRTSKQLLGESNAPSTLNLLDDYDEDDDSVEHKDKDTRDELPEFEDLPGVPYYRTVQRPPYNPDCVITYHNNDDIV